MNILSMKGFFEFYEQFVTIRFSSFLFVPSTYPDKMRKIGETRNVIEEVVDLVRQISTEMDGNDLQEFLDSY
ncbi:UNVERIFIED_CONTAM: hypothetical protein NCL1_44950 [Trichonephila clavipes]